MGTPQFWLESPKRPRFSRLSGKLPTRRWLCKFCNCFDGALVAAKMVYSMRVVPASFHTGALQDYGAKVRACFERRVGAGDLKHRVGWARSPFSLSALPRCVPGLT